MIKGLLIEDDEKGLDRAIHAASAQGFKETFHRYLSNDIQWAWVTSFDEFTVWIKENGVPDLLAFDHDLGGNSYKLWRKHNGYSNGAAINYDEYDEPTGYHCAKWLTEYCQDNKIHFTSEVHVHSMNSAGRNNILTLLNNFKTFQDRYGI